MVDLSHVVLYFTWKPHQPPYPVVLFIIVVVFLHNYLHRRWLPYTLITPILADSTNAVLLQKLELVRIFAKVAKVEPWISKCFLWFASVANHPHFCFRFLQGAATNASIFRKLMFNFPTIFSSVVLQTEFTTEYRVQWELIPKANALRVKPSGKPEI